MDSADQSNLLVVPWLTLTAEKRHRVSADMCYGDDGDDDGDKHDDHDNEDGCENDGRECDDDDDGDDDDDDDDGEYDVDDDDDDGEDDAVGMHGHGQWHGHRDASAWGINIRGYAWSGAGA